MLTTFAHRRRKAQQVLLNTPPNKVIETSKSNNKRRNCIKLLAEVLLCRIAFHGRIVLLIKTLCKSRVEALKEMNL